MNKERVLTIVMMALILLSASQVFADITALYAVAPLSEPAATLLLGAGLIGISRYGRKKSKGPSRKSQSLRLKENYNKPLRMGGISASEARLR